MKATMNNRPIYQIAWEIQEIWGSKVHPYAKPYLMAMKGLTDITDNYGYDSARSIILYFLSNASTFKGDRAKEIKAELKLMVK